MDIISGASRPRDGVGIVKDKEEEKVQKWLRMLLDPSPIRPTTWASQNRDRNRNEKMQEEGRGKSQRVTEGCNSWKLLSLSTRRVILWVAEW